MISQPAQRPGARSGSCTENDDYNIIASELARFNIYVIIAPAVQDILQQIIVDCIIGYCSIV